MAKPLGAELVSHIVRTSHALLLVLFQYQTALHREMAICEELDMVSATLGGGCEELLEMELLRLRAMPSFPLLGTV
jgi:hypothetical protein